MNNKESISIKEKINSTAIVFDNHALFADSFSKLIEGFYIFENVSAYTDEQNLLRALINIPPRVNVYLFLDYFLDGKTILPIINDVKRIRKFAKIILVTSVSNPAIIHSLLSDKINGILSKYSSTEEVINCIKDVSEGKQYLAGFIRDIIKETPAPVGMPFTNRELEIIQFSAQALTVDVIAQKLNLSRHTVAAHRRKILAKADCHSISVLLQLARKNGWIS